MSAAVLFSYGVSLARIMKEPLDWITAGIGFLEKYGYFGATGTKNKVVLVLMRPTVQEFFLKSRWKVIKSLDSLLVGAPSGSIEICSAA